MYEGHRRTSHASPPSHYRAALSQQYSVGGFATLLVLSCLHSYEFRSSCCNVVRCYCDLEERTLVTYTTVYVKSQFIADLTITRWWLTQDMQKVKQQEVIIVPLIWARAWYADNIRGVVRMQKKLHLYASFAIDDLGKIRMACIITSKI
jgi:hypothetical protein